MLVENHRQSDGCVLSDGSHGFPVSVKAISKVAVVWLILPIRNRRSQLRTSSIPTGLRGFLQPLKVNCGIVLVPQVTIGVFINHNHSTFGPCIIYAGETTSLNNPNIDYSRQIVKQRP